MERPAARELRWLGATPVLYSAGDMTANRLNGRVAIVTGAGRGARGAASAVLLLTGSRKRALA